MRVRIHYTLHDGYEDYEDSIDLSGDTVEEIREQADEHLAARGGTDPWSEVLNE